MTCCLTKWSTILRKWSKQFLEILEFIQVPQNGLTNFNNGLNDSSMDINILKVCSMISLIF
jgi:hypothetical protein